MQGVGCARYREGVDGGGECMHRNRRGSLHLARIRDLGSGIRDLGSGTWGQGPGAWDKAHQPGPALRAS